MRQQDNERPDDCDIATVVRSTIEEKTLLAVPKDTAKCEGCRYAVEEKGRQYCRARVCVESYLLESTGG